MLKELRVAPIIVLLLASIAFAASAFQEAPWRTFTSAEGKFSVLTPTEPKTEVRDVDSAVGKLTMYSYSSSSKAAYLLVSFGDYPNEPVDADHIEQVLNGVQSGVLGSIGGETISENKIVLKGRPNSGTTPVEYPGREFTGKKMGEGSEIFFS